MSTPFGLHWAKAQETGVNVSPERQGGGSRPGRRPRPAFLAMQTRCRRPSQFFGDLALFASGDCLLSVHVGNAVQVPSGTERTVLQPGQAPNEQSSETSHPGTSACCPVPAHVPIKPARHVGDFHIEVHVAAEQILIRARAEEPHARPAGKGLARRSQDRGLLGLGEPQPRPMMMKAITSA